VSRDLDEAIGSTLGHAARDVVKTVASNARKSPRGPLSGVKGIAAGIGLAALAPLAGKGIKKLASGGDDSGFPSLSGGSKVEAPSGKGKSESPSGDGTGEASPEQRKSSSGNSRTGRSQASSRSRRSGSSKSKSGNSSRSGSSSRKTTARRGSKSRS
jgi:hypothetical protein